MSLTVCPHEFAMVIFPSWIYLSVVCISIFYRSLFLFQLFWNICCISSSSFSVAPPIPAVKLLFFISPPLAFLHLCYHNPKNLLLLYFLSSSILFISYFTYFNLYHSIHSVCDYPKLKPLGHHL